MDSEIAAMEERHRKGRRVLKSGRIRSGMGNDRNTRRACADAQNLNDPHMLGPNMAIALLTTLYGSLLANMVFNPIAAKLEEKTESEIFIKQVMVEGIIGVQSGKPAQP